ncbi:MAG: aminotransferase class V-fold PLP-dependent enzyme, partial [Shimia sp.]
TYKTFGPHQGVMAIRSGLGEALPNQGHHFNGDVLWKKFTPAGPDHAQQAACAGICDYIDALYDHHNRTGRDMTGRTDRVHTMIQEAEKSLMAPLVDWLVERPDVRLLGPQTARGRAPTLALELAGEGRVMAGRLAFHGIMCSGGNFYADRALAAQGVDPEKGVLRLSLVHYNTPEEVERIIAALDAEL